MPTTQPFTHTGRARRDSGQGFGARPGRPSSSRILSETAHDLRSPLSSVRETIRLVADGDLGPVNEVQQQCLIDAISVCDSMERLVTDMLQLERLQSGQSRAVREWIDLQPLCHNVSAALESVLRLRNITIIWDGITQTTPQVFGDADKIGRLLSNLICNAARETAERQSVRIRASRSQDGLSLKLCVIDSGRGMYLDAWKSVAQRGTSERNSEGLGLSICRQFASAHHSTLTILSRVGVGTEISFELPIGGATSVATFWTQWRSQQRERVTPRRRTDLPDEFDNGLGHHRTFTLPDSQLLLLHHEGPPPKNNHSAILFSVSTGAAVSSKAVQAFNERLQRDQRAFDLVYRVSDRRWVVAWDSTIEEADERMEALSIPDSDFEDSALRLTWSSLRTLNLATSTAAVVLADAMTREALYEREAVGLLDDDMSNDGGTNFAPSPIPAERLQAELSHLSSRLGCQSKTLNRLSRARKQL